MEKTLALTAAFVPARWSMRRQAQRRPISAGLRRAKPALSHRMGEGDSFAACLQGGSRWIPRPLLFLMAAARRWRERCSQFTRRPWAVPSWRSPTAPGPGDGSSAPAARPHGNGSSRPRRPPWPSRGLAWRCARCTRVRPPSGWRPASRPPRAGWRPGRSALRREGSGSGHLSKAARRTCGRRRSSRRPNGATRQERCRRECARALWRRSIRCPNGPPRRGRRRDW